MNGGRKGRRNVKYYNISNYKEKPSQTKLRQVKSSQVKSGTSQVKPAIPSQRSRPAKSGHYVVRDVVHIDEKPNCPVQMRYLNHMHKLKRKYTNSMLQYMQEV